MPGLITAITLARISGWSKHPYFEDYPVVVHVIRRSQILCSSIADQPPPSSAAEQQGNCWFNMSIADFRLTESDLPNLVFMVGETDEFLSSNKVITSSTTTHKAVVVVEDIINATTRRHWVTGATFIEAQNAGLQDTDVIDLLYRDILGRAADPEGLSSYLFQRRERILSFNDIRKSLFDSNEYICRAKDCRRAPGAIFSQPLSLLLASAIGDAEAVAEEFETTESDEESSERPLLDESSTITWPSYPERDLQPLGQSSEDVMELKLPVDSILFGTGWHNLEYKHGVAFRWMETSGVIFSPKPECACISIALYLNAVYGSPTSLPIVAAYFDDTEADVTVAEIETTIVLKISPRDTYSKIYTKCRIDSRYSGCPVREDRGNDARILSLSVINVVITYTNSVGNFA